MAEKKAGPLPSKQRTRRSLFCFFFERIALHAAQSAQQFHEWRAQRKTKSPSLICALITEVGRHKPPSRECSSQAPWETSKLTPSRLCPLPSTMFQASPMDTSGKDACLSDIEKAQPSLPPFFTPC